jgi:hypothetical protein
MYVHIYVYVCMYIIYACMYDMYIYSVTGRTRAVRGLGLGRTYGEAKQQRRVATR